MSTSAASMISSFRSVILSSRALNAGMYSAIYCHNNHYFLITVIKHPVFTRPSALAGHFFSFTEEYVFIRHWAIAEVKHHLQAVFILFQQPLFLDCFYREFCICRILQSAPKGPRGWKPRKQLAQCKRAESPCSAGYRVIPKIQGLKARQKYIFAELFTVWLSALCPCRAFFQFYRRIFMAC